MSMIECIPNFSEGRRRWVLDDIADAIAAVPGVKLLDTHIDPDHNRSVITFAAPAETVGEAAFQGIKTAAQLIDLRQHSGQHPRIGAADVVPFVPLHGATEEQCVQIARALGQRLGTALRLPVYLYGAAALRHDRTELPDIRRGGYEGLRAAIGTDPARAPDFGPHALGPAGAVVVGTRPPLIAYNLYLDTDDVEIARQIARAVRGSSGGLPHVRALGLLVGGRAQVSMNLTDYRVTPAHVAVERVAAEAAKHGAAIVAGELVGLIPEDALLAAGRHALWIDHIGDAQILERRLAQVQASNAVHQPFMQQANDLWYASVVALAAAARELAGHETNHWQSSMLRTISQTLLPLLQQTRADDHPTAIRAWLLVARLAAKLAEALVAQSAAAEVSIQTAAIAHLAQSVVAGARLQVAGHLGSLQAEQAAVIDELADHEQRLRAIVATIDPL
jgi:glutamate formiminotransferase